MSNVPRDAKPKYPHVSHPNFPRSFREVLLAQRGNENGRPKTKLLQKVATPATQDKSVDQVASGIANVTSKSGTKRKAAFTPPVTPSASVTALMMGTKKIPAPLHTPINASVLVSEKAQLTPATTLTCKSATERGYILKENGKRIYFCPECNQKEETPMIGCDKCDRWYHFDCVGIEEEPPKEENWYCYTCSV